MLPQTPEQKQKLNKYVQQSVQLMKEKDVLDEDIKNVADIVVGEFDMMKKEFNAIVKAAYNREKMEEEIEQRQTAIANADILKGE